METTITTTLFRPFSSNRDRFSGKLEISRYRALNFKCIVPFSDDRDILEWLFEATNAPVEVLHGDQPWVFEVFYKAKEYSISVGDVIQLDDRYYLCKGIGWEKIDNFQENYSLD